jgi:cathepsin X
MRREQQVFLVVVVVSLVGVGVILWYKKHNAKSGTKVSVTSYRDSSDVMCQPGGQIIGSGEGGNGNSVSSGRQGKKRPNEYVAMKKPPKLRAPQFPVKFSKSVATPKEWDWRNVPDSNSHPKRIPGGNYCTPVMNQHIPQYCGSCWAQGSTSAVGDRLEILRRVTHAPGPMVILSVQVILNCAHDAGTCHGGDHAGVYEYLQNNGLPSESCNHYRAADGTCDAQGVCQSCWAGKNFFSGGFDSECCGVPNPTLYKIESSRTVPGNVEDIKQEIFLRGPVSCTINAEPIVNYPTRKPGDPMVIAGTDDTDCKKEDVDHIVSIVGYGDGYWIIRNSWGSYWGDGGFAYVKWGCMGMDQSVMAGYPVGYSAAGLM